MRISKQRMVDVLGPAPKPETVWEKQFDYHDEELLRMGQTDWDRLADGDLWYYFHDLSYQELQPDLFRHLLPRCLMYWYDTLMRNQSAECGDSEFHYALVHGNVPQKMMTESERERLYEFFRDGFLDRVEAERGFVYEPGGESANCWIFRFNSLGIVAPVIQRIWEDWWALDHPGKAVCAVMYSSGLVYLRGENPIYRVWTPKHGGGGPYLTEIDASIYDRGWRDDNLEFFLDTLTVDYVVQKLNQAADELAECPEAGMARLIADDAKTRREVIELRISDLMEKLAGSDFQSRLWE